MPAELGPQNYRDILESLATGVYVVDTSRRILLWNDGSERITGYLRHEVIGRFCQDNLLMHCSEDNTELCKGACPLHETMRDGRPREANIFLRHRDGQRVPVRVRTVPVRDADGVIIGGAESFDERHLVVQTPLHSYAQAVHNHPEGPSGVSDHASTASYLEACLRDFAEDHVPFGVLSFAIDGFERFRKAHGAEAAIRILNAIAATLSRNLQEAGVAGHWAENRFVAIVVNCPSATLPQIAGVLKGIVDTAAIPWWGDRVTVTVSIGGTAARADDTAESLLARSEMALLGGQYKGGNRVEVI